MPVEQLRRRRRHERILESALRVFSQKGYHQAVVDDIAADAETSKGGIYFHFPTKQAIFLALLDRTAALLRSKVEAAIAAEADPIAKADVALQVVLQTFASHRTLSRLFFVEALGAGPEFNQRMAELRASFAELIARHLDEAVRQGAIPPVDTAVAGQVWFGALNEVLTHWVLDERSGRLEDAYPTLRALLLRGLGAQLLTPPDAPRPTGPRQIAHPSPGNGAGPVRLVELAGGPDLDAARVRAVFERAAARARALDRPVLASLVLPSVPHDPLAFFERAGRGAERFFWSRPRTGYALAGVGVAWSWAAAGPDRFSSAAAEWRALCSEAIVEAPADTLGVGPLLQGGFAFDPLRRPEPGRWDGYPDGLLTLPRCLLTAADGASWLTLSAVLRPDDDPAAVAHDAAGACAGLLRPAVEASSEPSSHGPVEDVLSAAEWQALVELARSRIRAGAFEKVVLAREVRLRGVAPEPGPALRRLRADYPSCFVFAFGRGERCFLGASPERLVRLRDGLVTTMCLAGTMPRGASEAEDRQLGDALLASDKERWEHSVVLRELRAGLAELCDELAPISTPVLLKVRNVQHLLTTITAKPAPGQTILDLVGRLHPTPAVGGYPREAALEFIRQHERLDRGWYAGPIGWLDARGEGEFAVGIRSAVLRRDEASLFAGCGIVADSEPEAEYHEAALKLRPMLAALGVAAR